VARIALPPLRERREDIPAIVEHLLAKAAGAAPPKRVVPAALARLAAYRWPGNVRELENELMRALAFCGDSIAVADLSPQVAGEAEAALTTLEDPDSLTLRPRVERLERALLKEALSRSAGNQTRTQLPEERLRAGIAYLDIGQGRHVARPVPVPVFRLLVRHGVGLGRGCGVILWSLLRCPTFPPRLRLHTIS